MASLRTIAKSISLALSYLRLSPHLCAMLCALRWHPNRDLIRLDLERWIASAFFAEKRPERYSAHYFFIRLMSEKPEYRTLFYYRLGPFRKLLSPLCSPMSTLYLYTDNIGPGLFIQHGFSTIVCAKSIGKNCWINQQVTIGFSNGTDSPTLGDNVMICAGAKVIGNVHIGDNSVIGANAVVVKDIPANCTAVGIPAKVIRCNGARVNPERVRADIAA